MKLSTILTPRASRRRALLTTSFYSDHAPLRFPIDVCNRHHPERVEIVSSLFRRGLFHDFGEKRRKRRKLPCPPQWQIRRDTQPALNKCQLTPTFTKRAVSPNMRKSPNGKMVRRLRLRITTRISFHPVRASDREGSRYRSLPGFVAVTRFDFNLGHWVLYSEKDVVDLDITDPTSPMPTSTRISRRTPSSSGPPLTAQISVPWLPTANSTR